MNNFPAMTEERRQELVKHCKYNILQANGILPTLEGIDPNSEIARKVRKELELQEIALAALTAEPEVWIKPDSLGFPRLAGIDAVTIPYVPEYPIPLYTAPPAPVLKPITLPEALLPANHKSGEAFMAADSQGNYINREFTIKAIRAAGYEVKE